MINVMRRVWRSSLPTLVDCSSGVKSIARNRGSSIPSAVVFSHSFQVVHQLEHARVANHDLVDILQTFIYSKHLYSSRRPVSVTKYSQTMVGMTNPLRPNRFPRSSTVVNGEIWGANPWKFIRQILVSCLVWTKYLCEFNLRLLARFLPAAVWRAVRREYHPQTLNLWSIRRSSKLYLPLNTTNKHFWIQTKPESVVLLERKLLAGHLPSEGCKP